MKDSISPMLGARMGDLYRAAARSGIAAGDFLTPAEQAYLLTREGQDFPRGSLFFYGGYGEAERRLPVLCRRDTESWRAEITPADADMAVLGVTVPRGADMPDHRAFLGSLLALGLERSVIGDILRQEDRTVLFAKESIAPYILSSLQKVGKSPIQVSRIDLPSDFAPIRDFEELTLTVSSLRADAMVSAVLGCSREEGKEAVKRGLLSRNHLPFETPDGQLAEGDVLSLRGSGRFLFAELLGETKKGRLRVLVKKYV